MKRNYHTINKQGKANEKKLATFLSKGGQLLLPMVDLIEQCRMACDELIDVATWCCPFADDGAATTV